MPKSKHAVLILGASGAGKSDFALRLIARGCKLVADDQVMLKRSKDRVIASSPSNTKGLLEVRGIGIFKISSAKSSAIKLVVQLTSASKIERLPDAQTHTLLGVALPLLRLNPFEQSAVDKLQLAFQIVMGAVKLETGFVQKGEEK
jgi:serine kinase of HPr protein (carbohydrate metabolism regulator)